MAPENTWIHQRRKRREQIRSKATDDSKTCEYNVDNTQSEAPPTKKIKLDEQSSELCKDDSTENKTQLHNNSFQEEIVNSSAQSPGRLSSHNLSVEDIESYVVKSTLTVRKNENDIRLEMLWIDGQSKELLHQLMQVLKNKLK